MGLSILLEQRCESQSLRKGCQMQERRNVDTQHDRAHMQEHIGVGVIVHKRWWDKVDDVRPLDGRMMNVELKAKPPIPLFIVDAPTAVKDVETKELFYDKLLSGVRRINRRIVLHSSPENSIQGWAKRRTSLNARSSAPTHMKAHACRKTTRR